MKIAGLPSPQDGAPQSAAAKTKEVSESFSSLFMENMLQAMRKTVPKSDLINGGNSEEIYRSLLDAEYAKIMSQTSGKNLSEMIAKQLGALQKDMDKNKLLNSYRSAAIAAQQDLPIPLPRTNLDNQ